MSSLKHTKRKGNLIKLADPLAENLILYAPFINDAGTSIKDFSKSRKDGAFQTITAANWVQASTGRFVDFAGSSNTHGISFGSTLLPQVTNKFTALTVVIIDAAPSANSAIFGNTNTAGSTRDWMFYCNATTANITFNVQNTTPAEVFVGGYTPVLGGVYVLCGTFDGTTVTSYINGNFHASSALAGNVRQQGFNTNIGRWSTGTLNFKSGFAAMWNRCLSPQEVAKISSNPWFLMRNSYENRAFISFNARQGFVDHVLSGNNTSTSVQTAVLGLEYVYSGNNTSTSSQTSKLIIIRPVDFSLPAVVLGYNSGLVNKGSFVDSSVALNQIYMGAVNTAVKIGTKVYVVTKQHTLNGWRPVLYKTIDRGNSWTKVADIDSGEFGTADASGRNFQTVACCYDSSTDRLHIVWTDFNNSGDLFHIYMTVISETFGSKTTIASANVGPPACITTNGSDRVLISATNIGSSIYYSYWNGSSWSSWTAVGSQHGGPFNISTAYCSIDELFHSMVTENASGDGALLQHWTFNINTNTWTEKTGTTDRPFHDIRARDAASGLSYTTNIIKIVSDSSGNLHAVMQSASTIGSSKSDFCLYYNSYNGSEWGQYEGFGRLGTTHDSEPTICIVSNNTIYVLSFYSLSVPSIFYRRLSEGIYGSYTLDFQLNDGAIEIVDFLASQNTDKLYLLSADNADKLKVNYLLKDVRVWNFSGTVLPNDIDDIMAYHSENMGAVHRSLNSVNLVGRWRFDDKPETNQLLDNSIYNNHGYPVNISGTLSNNIGIITAADFHKHNLGANGYIDDFNIFLSPTTFEQVTLFNKYKKTSW